MMRISLTLPLLTLALTARAADLPDYDRDVKPIFVKHCFKCHGDEAKKGGLRVDFKASMLKGGESGEPAIVPGSSAKSHLIKLVTTASLDDRMPPKGEPLTAAEVAVIRKWIDTGAHWIDNTPVKVEVIHAVDPGLQVTEKDRQFWSFVAPRRSVGGIDGLIAAELKKANLTPSPRAEHHVLARRVAFDLTGLPPAPDDLDLTIDQLIEKYLASPHFGERFASLWLPLARYAEDQAHQVGADTKFFYPHAFKYRRWVMDAFNRDLPYDQFIQLQLAADLLPDAEKNDLPALGLLGLGPKYYNRGRLEVMADEWEDRVDTITRTTLGLTVACARCHDHKFDPIPTTDYYALAGVFASTKMVNKTPAGVIQKAEKAEQWDPATLHIVEDEKEPKDLNLFIRGNVDRKGPPVPRRFITVLSSGSPQPFKQGSGRLELARLIASKDNPLTARVFVNRVWGYLMGAPLVSTPSNFGKTGEPPTHPALLDDLAVRFMENGWSVKWLVREIVTSATYQQTSASNAANASIDPANIKLWRAHRKRMSVEQWRDSMLLFADQLDPTGGTSLELDDPANFRRTVYARISRLKLNDLLMQFDYPDANVHAERRSVTNTPMLKLFVLNSGFMQARADALVKRLASEADDSAKVKSAYRLLFSRAPSDEELSLALNYLGHHDNAKLSRWQRYAHILLASNEALYVD